MDTTAELEALKRGALLRPLPHLGTLAVTGEERQSWLSGQVTCEVKSLRPAEARYGLHLSKQGRIQAELWIVLGEDRILLGLREDLRAATREQMEHHLIMEDAAIEPAEHAPAWWIGHGPEVAAVASAARQLGATAGIGTLGRLPTVVVVAGPEIGPRLADALMAPKGTVLATPAGWEQACLAWGLPELGVDYQLGDYPQEAAIEQLGVSFTKGCYVGQEAVFMLEKRGHPPRRLVRLTVSVDGATPSVGAAVTAASGATVGQVTRIGAVAGQTLAFAMVRHGHHEQGTELAIGASRAVVAPMPQGAR